MVSASPKVQEVHLEPISVSKSEAWFRLADKVLVLKRRKNSKWTLYVLDGSQIVAGYSFNPSCKDIVVNGADICPALNRVVENWDLFVEQQEVIKRAEAAKVMDYAVVPKTSSDWEVMIATLTKLVLSRRVVKNFVIRDGNREVSLGLYCYNDGWYQECEKELRHEIEQLASQSKLLEERVLGGLVGEVIKKIERKTYEVFKPDKRCLLFKNKVFCWDRFLQTKDLEQSLIDPSPDLVVVHSIPWEVRPELYKLHRQGLMKYVPPRNIDDLIELFKGLSPKSFNAFLSWVRYPDEPERNAYPRVALLLEVIGYTLYPHGYPFHKAVLLVGEGSNGKSTYLNLIVKILGNHNISSVPLEDLDPKVNRFAISSLWGKLANISTEPAKITIDPTKFKQLTGEDPVMFEMKYRNPFSDYNYAKMLFAANELPKPPEDTYAWWSRWIVIEFPNRFPQNPRFFEETFTPEEIEGIIICALHAFRLAIERGGFTEQGTKDPKEEWMSRSSHVYRVVKLMEKAGLIEFKPGMWVQRDDLYALYIKVCKAEDIRPLSKGAFTRELQRLFGVRLERKKGPGGRIWCYTGVSLTNTGVAALGASSLDQYLDHD